MTFSFFGSSPPPPPPGAPPRGEGATAAAVDADADAADDDDDDGAITPLPSKLSTSAPVLTVYDGRGMDAPSAEEKSARPML